MAEVVLITKLDASRPTLQIKGLQEKLDPKAMGAFFLAFAGPLFRQRASERFALEGDDASGTWKPLAQATVSRRMAAGQTPIKINDRTGAMRAWVEGAPGVVKTAAGGVAMFEWPGTPTNRTIGKKLKTAQMGQTAPYTPARPVIVADNADLLSIAVAAEEWIMDQ